jgi:predicted membrane channel-forming protein YqfA (hemolysin III family)
MDERELRKKRDKELIELLNELRVALPGVQVLFAFLLVVPFSSRFDVDRTEKVAYMIALLATVVGTILFIAPSAYHRLRWREKNKERMLRTSNQLAIWGLAAVAVAISASLFLVTDVLLPRSWASVVTAVAAAGFALAWFALPLSRPYGPDGPDED